MLGVVKEACPDMVSVNQVIDPTQTISIQRIDCSRSKLLFGIEIIVILS
jgi:hypothetical protein